MRDFLEATCGVEALGQYVGERFIMDKAISMCRANGLFVKVLRLELAPLDACDLRAHQCGAGFEILRAILRPYFELFVMRGQSLEVLPSLVGYRGIAARRMGKRTIEVILRRFKK